jgi:hypothetical protein
MRINEEHYNQAVQMLGGPDELNTKGWWDK